MLVTVSKHGKATGPPSIITLPVCLDGRKEDSSCVCAVAEGSIKLPEYPVMFMKPPNAITDYGADIEIPKIAQDSQADYEGELVVIIARDCKDVAKEDAMQHVLGYTVGNDVSTR
jgi:2-keto-4-pentenoate hydratase/2-oxohepta-3-ene-1,7-dioic acid hydratase in catechol pathway